MSELGVILKKERLSKNLSIRKASLEIGISHTYLDSLEKGLDPRTNNKRKPTPEVLRKLSRYYEISYETLMEKEGYL